MRLHVSKQAQALGIRMPSACLVGPIVPAVMGEHLPESDYASTEATLLKCGDLLASESAKSYRQLFDRMGYPMQTPAGERLVQSFAEKGFKRYNALIDACNIASIESVSGLGLHDRDSVDGDIRADRASGDETILPLYKDKAVALKRGDLFYADASGVIAWLGKRDVDSDRHKVTGSTRSVILIALGHEGSTFDDTKAICQRFYDLVRTVDKDLEIRFAEIHLE